MQSEFMQSDWAVENLQVIRTLMERSSLYRRALAPVMTLAGIAGLAATTFSYYSDIHRKLGFSVYWIIVGVFTLFATFLLVRRQALQDKESVWSSPTRRVVRALLPPFLVGLFAGLLFIPAVFTNMPEIWFLPPIWMICYGCGLHTAGFFMPRGIRLYGWSFIIAGCALILLIPRCLELQSLSAAHRMMGVSFGAIHLAYGIYLYFTENRKNAA